MNLFRSFLIVLFFTFSLHADDLCYENPYNSGFFFTKNIIPIKHTDNGTVLENVKIIYAISGFSFSFMETIGIDGNTFSATVGDDDAERNSLISMNFGTGMPNFSMFDKGYNYYLHQMSNGEVQETWTSEFFFTNWMSEFFSSTKLFAEYYKNGEFYRVILNPCSGNDVTVPTVSVADASMQSPTQDAIMTFNVTLSGTLSSEIETDSYIHYKTLNDTAVAGVDYIAVDNTLMVPAGQISADITVTIKAGASGKFKLLLDNAYGASISDGEAIGSVYSEYGLCYAGSTGDNINTGKCILAGAFYSATNKTPHDCDAQVTIVNRDGDALSNVSVFKIYDSNANSGTCSGGDSCNGPSIRSISGFPDHNSGYEYIWPSFAGDSNQTVTDSDTWSSSGDFDDIILYGSYTKDGLNYAQKISSCGGGGGYIEEGLGNGDFIDTNINTAALSNAYNASTDTSSLGLKFIKTKIASETTPLTAVYLNDFGVNADYDNNSSGDVDKKLWFAIPVLNDLDATGGCPSANSSLLQQIIDPATNLQAIFTIKDSGASDYSQTKDVIIPANASKNAKIEMIIVDTSKLNEDAQNCVEVSSTTGNLEGLGQCVNSAVQYVDAYGQTAYERCAINDTYGKPCLSQNNGAGTGLFNSPLGCFMCTFYAGTACSSDDFAIRPNDFNATIAPNEIFTAGNPKTITFRADNSVGAPTNNYNEVEDDSFFVDVNISDSSKTCQESSINFSPSVNFTNGAVTDDYTLHNVGDFNVTIAERVGYEFALVDTDDTLDPADRLITPYTQQIKVIPDHFEVVGGLTNGSNGFTYLSNFEEHNTTLSRDISASLDLNVSAQKADNNITSNYTQECYAKDGNITLALAPIVINPTNSLTELLWYHYDNDGDTNGSIDLNTTLPPYVIPFLSTHFDSNDTNGTANFNYKINFDRNLTKVVNPFMVVVTAIDAEDNDSVTGNNSLDSNATFAYGRTHASRQRYSCTTSPCVKNANIYFESYCFGTGCDKTLLNGFSPNLMRTDDVRWYINEAHVLPNDGIVGAVSEKVATPHVTETASVTNTNPIRQTTTLRYNGSKGYPYKTTMQNEASPWLIYNESDPFATRNEFQVEFDNAGDWTGEHDTDTTTKTPDGTTTNRRIMW
ncbi:hypothetical protein [Sulfurimonas sp.]|uniref:hypothetical protein n=1 Tax=Sulfurimonas sp. TaxID=2022749 RepID=UPI0025FF0F29|nr:hypothetical protein [Sulfurimonas sp.]MBW6487765.1 hypothetical protein [Sulfurimonas sp.]